MSTLLVWKEQLQLFYGKYASYVDKVLKFILGLFVFGLINSNIGFMKSASSMVVTLGLSLICAFLPPVVMTFLASALILLHFYSLSLPVVIVTAMILLLMYIFYFRFTPKKAWLILVTVVAFALKVPYAVPIAFGLFGTAIYVIPVACGTMIYYMLHYVKTSSAALKSSGADGLIDSLMSYAKQVFQNKEMLVMMLALTICLLLVYNIRTRSADHAWKIAIVSGVVANIVMVIAGDIMLGVRSAYVSLVVGSLISALIGFCLEFFIFSVDYSRTQRIQFEDDEYYYYVKAVPKIAVSVPEKTVKRINERHEELSASERRTDEELLKQSLHKELGIQHNHK